MSTRLATSREARVLVVFVALLALCVGCAPSDGSSPRVRKARAIYDEMISADPQYAAYALSIVSRTDSPSSQRLVLDSLDAADQSRALEAMRRLGDAPAPSMTGALQEVFRQKRGSVKRLAAVTLARGGDATAMDWLREDVTESAGFLNVEGMKLLAEQGEKDKLVAVLEPRMASDDLATRNEAYDALGELKTPWATQMLLRGLDREHGEDRLQAIVALGRTGDEAAVSKIQSFTNTQGLVLETIEALGNIGSSKSATRLKRLVGHKEEHVRVYAAAAVWRMGDSETAREAMEGLVVAEDASVRRMAAEQLAKVDDAAASALLVRLVDDSDKQVQTAALRSLMGSSTPEAIAALEKAMTDTDYEVAALALNGLALVQAAAAVPGIEPLLEHENPYVAIAAADAILTIEDIPGPPAG